MSLLLSSRNHHLTFGVGCVVVCVTMMLFLLHKTHEQLEITKGDLLDVNDKFASLTRQFESLYEYKERLEKSYVDLKERKSVMTTQSDSLKSELSVLKQSHRTEMQRLQDDLDLCRRHEEMAVIRNQPQRDEALPPEIQQNGRGNSIDTSKHNKPSTGDGDHEQKVINSLSKSSAHHYSNTASNNNHQPPAGNVISFVHNDKDAISPVTNPPSQAGMQPSVDPNQDPVGNVFI